jgi:hypothetical protein
VPPTGWKALPSERVKGTPMFLKDEHHLPRHTSTRRRRYRVIPAVIALVIVSIGLVGTIFELLYLWIKHA